MYADHSISGTTQSLSSKKRGPLRVALCQVATREWDVDGNFQRTVDALHRAADEGAVLAITPECVFHGYPEFLGADDIKRMKETAESVNGARIGQIRELAHKRGINVVLGFAEKGSGGAVHNSAVFINSNGHVTDLYRKVHCREFEADWCSGAYTPGDSFSVIGLHHDGETYRIGLIICFDREIPESVRCLRSLGAEFILCPLATDTFDMQGDGMGQMINNEIITRCRAVENEVFIAVVNHASRFNGGSYIVDPFGQCIYRMGSEEGVSVVDVSVEQASAMHKDKLSWMGWGFWRPEIYQKYLTHKARSE